jgi:predicted nucleic acid-binding protein
MPRGSRYRDSCGRKVAFDFWLASENSAAASSKLAMPLAEIREVLETVTCRADQLTVEDHDRAVHIMARYKFSFFD